MLNRQPVNFKDISPNENIFSPFVDNSKAPLLNTTLDKLRQKFEAVNPALYDELAESHVQKPGVTEVLVASMFAMYPHEEVTINLLDSLNSAVYTNINNMKDNIGKTKLYDHRLQENYSATLNSASFSNVLHEKSSDVVAQERPLLSDNAQIMSGDLRRTRITPDDSRGKVYSSDLEGRSLGMISNLFSANTTVGSSLMEDKINNRPCMSVNDITLLTMHKSAPRLVEEIEEIKADLAKLETRIAEFSSDGNLLELDQMRAHLKMRQTEMQRLQRELDAREPKPHLVEMFNKKDEKKAGGAKTDEVGQTSACPGDEKPRTLPLSESGVEECLLRDQFPKGVSTIPPRLQEESGEGMKSTNVREAVTTSHTTTSWTGFVFGKERACTAQPFDHPILSADIPIITHGNPSKPHRPGDKTNPPTREDVRKRDSIALHHPGSKVNHHGRLNMNTSVVSKIICDPSELAPPDLKRTILVERAKRRAGIPFTTIVPKSVYDNQPIKKVRLGSNLPPNPRNLHFTNPTLENTVYGQDPTFPPPAPITPDVAWAMVKTYYLSEPSYEEMKEKIIDFLRHLDSFYREFQDPHRVDNQLRILLPDYAILKIDEVVSSKKPRFDADKLRKENQIAYHLYEMLKVTVEMAKKVRAFNGRVSEWQTEENKKAC